jgi:hypothetical protein
LVFRKTGKPKAAVPWSLRPWNDSPGAVVLFVSIFLLCNWMQATTMTWCPYLFFRSEAASFCVWKVGAALRPSKRSNYATRHTGVNEFSYPKIEKSDTSSKVVVTFC